MQFFFIIPCLLYTRIKNKLLVKFHGNESVSRRIPRKNGEEIITDNQLALLIIIQIHIFVAVAA